MPKLEQSKIYFCFAPTLTLWGVPIRSLQLGEEQVTDQGPSSTTCLRATTEITKTHARTLTTDPHSIAIKLGMGARGEAGVTGQENYLEG